MGVLGLNYPVTPLPTSLLCRKENKKDDSESLMSRDEPCSPDLKSYITKVRLCFVIRSGLPQLVKCDFQSFKFKEDVLMH